MSQHEKQNVWWSTLPGLITATAAIVTAITGLLVGLHQIGVFDKDNTNSITDEKIKRSATLNTDAWSYSFDGFRLGSIYQSEVMLREPYDKPCDNDPVKDEYGFEKWRAMVYGGAILCRGRSFPEGTTVVFFLPFTEGRDRYAQPISSFAWLGGNYFSRRSTFPLSVGQSLSDAISKLGEPIRSLSLRNNFVAHEHQGKIYTLTDNKRVVGFLFGGITNNTESEQWDVIIQMYFRYTVGLQGLHK